MFFMLNVQFPGHDWVFQLVVKNIVDFFFALRVFFSIFDGSCWFAGKIKVSFLCSYLGLPRMMVISRFL